MDLSGKTRAIRFNAGLLFFFAAGVADAQQPGVSLHDAIKLNRERRGFSIFGPNETLSNRRTSVFEATERQ